MPLHAFGLTAEYEGTVEVDGAEAPRFGGTLTVPPDGRTFDVAAALRDGNGKIVVTDADPYLLNVLDNYDALKRVALGDADLAAVRSSYEGRILADLRDEAARRGLTIEAGVRKDALIRALVAHDAGISAGDDTLAPTHDHPVDVTPEGAVEPAQEA